MSYSLDKKCNRCKNVDSCLDAEIVQGAINTIHQLNNYVSYPSRTRVFQAHKGGGTIEIKCSNFQPDE
jgi:hypothetical protein